MRLIFHPPSSASFRSSLTSWGDCHAHGAARILWHIIHLAAHHARVAVGSCTHCRPATLQSRIAICVDLHLCRRCHCLLKLQRGRHEELLVFIVSFGKVVRLRETETMSWKAFAFDREQRRKKTDDCMRLQKVKKNCINILYTVYCWK